MQPSEADMPKQNSKTKKSKSTTPQSYPRLPEGDTFAGFLDDAALQGHVTRISREQLDVMIAKAIAYANLKSSREMLDMPDDITPEMVEKIYVHEGRELFRYMVKYCGDPASTAYRCLNQTYAVIAEEQFYNRTRQKQRMNSGWRYQSLAKDAVFANYNNTEVAQAMLAALMTTQPPIPLKTPIPNQVIEAFGACCREYDLLNGDGRFKDAYQLVELFVNPPAIKNPHPLKNQKS
jgi:hypothetical protein